MTSARAMATRFFMPPESSLGILSSVPFKPDHLELFGDDAGDFLGRLEPVLGQVEPDVFARRSAS